MRHVFVSDPRRKTPSNLKRSPAADVTFITAFLPVSFQSSVNNKRGEAETLKCQLLNVSTGTSSTSVRLKNTTQQSQADILVFMDFQLLRDENGGVKLLGFRYFVKASLIFYTPASCIDSFWCKLFLPLTTL